MLVLLCALLTGVFADGACSDYDKKKFCNEDENCNWDGPSKTCMDADKCPISNLDGDKTHKSECVTREECFWVSGIKECKLKAGMECAGLNKHSCLRLGKCEWNRDAGESGECEPQL